MEKYGKTAVFPGGYGRIGEIPHGLMAGLGSIGTLSSNFMTKNGKI